MLWFKCNTCGHVISEEEVGRLVRQVLGGGHVFGSFSYKTCMKCGGKEIETAESMSSAIPPNQFYCTDSNENDNTTDDSAEKKDQSNSKRWWQFWK